jgi:pimeloyl-ACP methyl ester carboxylesterase
MSVKEKAVLLLHGWPGTSDGYHLIRSLLPTDRRVIAPDLTGFSEAYDGIYPSRRRLRMHTPTGF